MKKRMSDPTQESPYRLSAFCAKVDPHWLDFLDRDGVAYRLPMQYSAAANFSFFDDYVRNRWVDIDFTTGIMGVEPTYGAGSGMLLLLVWLEDTGVCKFLAMPWEDPPQGR